MRNPEFESIPHYASPTYRVNNNLSSNRDDHRKFLQLSPIYIIGRPSRTFNISLNVN